MTMRGYIHDGGLGALREASDEELQELVRSSVDQFTERRHPAVIELFLSDKSILSDRRQAAFVASTSAIDSYGERVLQNWRLDRFLANPIVLYNHQRFGSDLPIGTAEVAVVNGRLECVITFASEKASPLAEQVWNSVQERVLRAVSVGFRPHTIRMELEDDEEVTVLDDNELYEISVTPLPANPEALSKMKTAARDAAVRARALKPHAEERAKEATMTTESKDLQATLEARAVELKTANDKIKELEAKTADSAAQVSELTRQKVSLEANVATLTTEKTAAETRADALDCVLTSVGTILGLTKDDRDDKGQPSVLKAAERLKRSIVERDVDALVGVKIAPAQRDKFLKLALKDRESFDEIVSDLPVLGGGQGLVRGKVMGADPNPAPETGGASKHGGADFAAAVDAELADGGAGGDFASLV